MIYWLVRTLRNRQKPKKNKAITVSSTRIIVYVADRKVNRVIFDITGPHRHGGLIAAGYCGNKKCAVRLRILSNDILDIAISREMITG